MTLHSFQDGERFIANSMALLAQAEIDLTVGYDFDEYHELLKEARPDHLLGMPFDPTLHEMNQENAFWIVGRNAKNDIMHTQAMRMLDLQGMNLAEHLRRSFTEFPPPGVDIDLQRSRYRAGPGAHRISGKVCYHGEFWVGTTPREFRNAGLSSVLGRFAFWQAIQHWNPDYVIAFMQNSVVFKGFPARHGYMHTEPGTLRWFMTGQDTPIEGFMSYMGSDDLRFILEMPLSDLAAQAA
jgi:hypothetical protein